KVVLFIDGQEMNESLYSTLQFGNHYPIDHIERIEIIRGPGSALHGGFAAYAVINIITRTPKNGRELSATAYSSRTAEAAARQSMGLYLGQNFSKGSYAVKINGSETQRSHREYRDVYGGSYDMRNNSRIRNLFLNAGGQIGGLQLRLLSDNYTLQSRDEYVESAGSPHLMQFTQQSFEAKYEWTKNEKLKIIPRFRFSYQNPWSTPKKYLDEDPEPFRINSLGYLASINGSYNAGPKLNLSGGGSWQLDHSRKMLEGEVFQTTGTSTLINENAAVFGQLLYAAAWANLIAGVRFNFNRRYENAIVPRLGLTREFRHFHFKALYSRAFRAPSTQNIDLSENIQPEYTDVYELEGGVKISDAAYLTLNAFQIISSDPIVYFVDTVTNTDAYTNLSSSGTRGLELIFQYRRNRLGLDLNGSYYHARDGAGLGLYQVPGEDGIHLGLATYKANAAVRYAISSSLLIGLQYTWLSSRYGISAVDETTEAPVYTRYPSMNLVNAHLDYRFRKLKGLSVRFSVRNILDEEELFIQPYNSQHAPLPGMDREFQLRISYQNF
ncbi:MAG: TonB-dependent receptor plug domain-containing protein, partial [Bacteroidia bacterium]|nr:TonB-dependent receptor plug domain-containing protein [Bacteroidia bacterium]